MKRYASLCISLCLFTAFLTACSNSFPNAAKEPGFEIYGRTLNNDQGHIYLTWPGTSIEGRFTGSGLSIVLDDERGDNYFNVFIDGDTDAPVVIDAKKGKHTYQVADNLAEGKHSFELYKRTEGHEGGTWFLGLELEENQSLLSPPPRPKRRIAFFGDSITSGMGNEAAIGETDKVLAEKNNYLAYGSMTARALEAEHQTISLSGIGIMISWFDIIMPNYYDQISGVGDNETKWLFDQWQPHAVVINLTQNDSWLIDKRKRLKPQPTAQDIVNAYVDLVAKIQKVYPNAYYICALGSMDAVRPNSPWPGYVRAAVEALRVKNPTIDIDSLFFDYTGFDAHPRVQHHQSNAKKLTDALSNQLGW